MLKPITSTTAKNAFQCRERLEWDFYVVEATDTKGKVFKAFQCRERLEWDFYSPTELSG